jgi:hypothetical protein
MRISRITDLNDPFELLAVDATKWDGGLEKLRAWRDKVNKYRGLLCFSKAYRDPVLWSHYAAKHKGVCLGFDIAKEVEVKEVTYEKNRINGLFIDNDAAKGIDESFEHKIFTTKYAHWGYEDEIRVLVQLSERTLESGSYFYGFDEGLTLREIIVGALCETPGHILNALVQRLYGAQVPVKKAVLADSKFEIRATTFDK